MSWIMSYYFCKMAFNENNVVAIETDWKIQSRQRIKSVGYPALPYPPNRAGQSAKNDPVDTSVIE